MPDRIADQLRDILQDSENRVAQAFLGYSQYFQEYETRQRIQDQLATGRYGDLENEQKTASGRILDELLVTYAAVGRLMADYFSDLLKRPIGVDRSSPTSVNAILSIANNIKNLIDTEREYLVSQYNRSPQGIDTSLLGLSTTQRRQVESYRDLLRKNKESALQRTLRDRTNDEQIRDALRRGEPLTETQIDRMVRGYRATLLQHRALVIAQTESVRVIHESIEDLLLQLSSAGVISMGQVERTWITARDERVRSSHTPMHGKTALQGMSFISGAGVPLRYPGDPSAPLGEIINCRCILVARIV